MGTESLPPMVIMVDYMPLWIEKLGDYTLRLLGTPIAVALDAAMILVVGTVSMTIDAVIHKARQKCRMDPDCHL